ncbi:MAG: sensor domain-containing diguanylate cyclase [Desulfosalsimonadaceae bacterium]
MLTFYAITKYRLFDIKTAIMQAVFIVSAIAAAALVQLGLYMAARMVLAPEWALVLSFIVLALGLIMVPQVSTGTEKFLDFVSPRHGSYHRLLTETAQAIISILDLQELMSYLARSVSQYLQVEQVALLLPDDGGSLALHYSIAPISAKEEIPPVTVLGKRLEKAKSAMELNAEKHRLPAGEAQLLEREIRSLRMQLAVPILYRDNVKGILILGEKADGSAFVKQDYETLEALAGQAAVAFENARLYQLAIRDGMTGLYHHSHFRDRLAEEISRSRRYNLDLALILMDIDHFKQFNDRYGHLAGDRVIREVAKMIAGQARESDLAARYDGEEFAILLPETGLKAGCRYAERLRRIVAGRPLAGHRVTISLGVSTWRDSDGSPEALIQKADQALYEAKQQGRNRVMSRQ